jgi:hypothetical protein
VTILLHPDQINGESWETRKEYNLTENFHYLSIDGRKKNFCDEIEQKVDLLNFLFATSILLRIRIFDTRLNGYKIILLKPKVSL